MSTPAGPGAPAGHRLAPEAAWHLGQRHEAAQDRARRTAAGAWFTPPALARQLAASADPPRAPRTVLDPACGGGAFLLAAHERWPSAHLHGIDADPSTARIADRAVGLALAAEDDLGTAHPGVDHPGDGARPTARHTVVVGDGLLHPAAPADVVLANPPFLSQLRAGTARDRSRREDLIRRYGNAATRYVDEAAVFLLAIARDMLAPEGVAVVVVPEALLATADCRAVRQEVASTCDVEVVWRDTDRVFPGTPTCAVRLARRPPVAHVRPMADGGWPALLAAEVPRVTVPQGGRTIGDIATATADFRDAYYLLADHVADHVADDSADDVADDSAGHLAHTSPMDEGEAGGTTRSSHPKIVPVGLIDPAHLRWGEVPVRFAKRTWARPVAVGLPQGFLDRRLGPKVLVATQTRVLEVLVDVDGALLPSTPVISVRTDRPWHVAAALTSPVLTAIAARRHAGAARSRGALKLSARQVLALPLPLAHGDGAWDRAADLIEQAHRVTDGADRRVLVRRCGEVMAEAYGPQDPGLVEWWAARLPQRP